MAAFPAIGVHGFLDGNRLRIEGHLRPEFPAGGGADAVRGCLLVSNDASGNVPACSVGLILPPREESPVAIVLDQKIHIDQRREATKEEEELLRQPASGLAHPGVQRRKGLLVNVFDHSGYDDTRSSRQPGGASRLITALSLQPSRKRKEQCVVCIVT